LSKDDFHTDNGASVLTTEKLLLLLLDGDDDALPITREMRLPAKEERLLFPDFRFPMGMAIKAFNSFTALADIEIPFKSLFQIYIY
jgi:hypothetical protein